MWASEAIALLAERAADQWGLVTAAQAVTAGVERNVLTRLTAAGIIRRLDHAVYQIVGATDVRFLDEKVAWLRLAPGRTLLSRQPLDTDGGVLSHRSATKLHCIGDLAAPAVEIIVPVRRQSRNLSITLRRRLLDPADVTTVEALPVTTVERTITDLAAEHVDGGHLGDLIADAQVRGILDRRELARRIAIHGPAYGTPPYGDELIEYLLHQAGRTPICAAAGGRQEAS
ncbi:MAG: type IV toxin-antitoxin system AbiEi family antitoxin domain-containing protein [Mycobacteriales bacterium]